MKILIIEDDPFWQTKMQMMLQELNVREVMMCDDIISAKKNIAEYEPELIIADILLANGTVFELFANNAYQEIPILFITQSYDDAFYEQSKFKPNVHYLVKPFHKITLLSAIDKLTEKNITTIDMHGIYVRGVNAEKIFISSKQIVYLKSELNYCVIKTKNNQFVTKGSLINIKKNLGDKIIQIHKTYLVNKNCIVKVNIQEMQVETIMGIFPIGRVFKKNIYQYLAETVVI